MAKLISFGDTPPKIPISGMLRLCRRLRIRSKRDDARKSDVHVAKGTTSVENEEFGENKSRRKDRPPKRVIPTDGEMAR